MARHWYSLNDLPKIHDIIWCNIPFRETPDVPGPPHPALVREIEKYEPLGQAIIHVSRGTTNLKKDKREFLDLIIEKPGEMAFCGLKESTRFDLDDSQSLVPCFWDNFYFPSIVPVGKLNLDCIRRMDNRLRGWKPIPDQFKQK
jgi:hypothetical protein